MTDREMLEWAAKTAGWRWQATPEGYLNLIDVAGRIYPKCCSWPKINIVTGEANPVPTFAEALRECGWNPLESDGVAFRLATQLGLDLLRTERDVEAIAGLPPYASMNRDVPAPCGIELLGDDPYAATRRAITRAAAEIGRAMG